MTTESEQEAREAVARRMKNFESPASSEWVSHVAALDAYRDAVAARVQKDADAVIASVIEDRAEMRTALLAALKERDATRAEGAGEEVAWAVRRRIESITRFTADKAEAESIRDGGGFCVPLYATPPLAPEVTAEKVALMEALRDVMKVGLPEGFNATNAIRWLTAALAERGR